VDRLSSNHYRKRVVGIAARHSQRPDNRWDTLDLLLECHHTHAVQRFRVGTFEDVAALETEYWKGREFPCPKCVAAANWRLKAS
jgi:hypothetical protein